MLITTITNPTYACAQQLDLIAMFEFPQNGLEIAAREIGTDTAGLAKALIETAPDTVALVNPQGVIVYINHRITDVLGYNADELTGMSVDTLLPPDLRGAHVAHRQRFQTAAATRPMGSSLDLKALHSDGSLVPVEISLSPLPGNDGRMWVIAVIRDVTARKTLEEQSRATHAHLLVSNDRERIARDLHDSVIQQLFASGLTLQAVASVSDGHVVQRIESTIDDLDGTISVLRDAIFDLQRHNEGQAHSVRIRNTIEAALQSSNASMAALEGTELLDQLPQSLVSDIDAVIRELITNATRHGNPRRIAVLINDSDGLVVEIRDDGRGFSFENPEGNGLPNLRTRAMQYGGHFSVSRDISNLWTIARWEIPGGNHA